MVFFIFIQILIESSVKKNSGDPDQMPRSDHCLPMSHKKDAICLYGLNITFNT